jgi:hypothetical protein
MILYGNPHKRLTIDDLAKMFFMDNLGIIDYMRIHELRNVHFPWPRVHMVLYKGVIPDWL